ncbi:MAG: hypothetical protein Kow0080_06650 [Candidatus Promineifilaceae bacterium]
MTKPIALIVEDDNMLGTFFTATLADAGFQTELAQNGAEALAYLEKNAPTLILLDLQLPDTTGEGILSYIETQAHLAQTRIFATSIEGTRASYLQEKVDLVLTKPVSYHQLINLSKRMIPAEHPAQAESNGE